MRAATTAFFGLALLGKGNTNLGTCQVMIAGASGLGEFNTANATCYATINDTTCNESSSTFIVDVVVANSSGGFTTASLTVRP